MHGIHACTISLYRFMLTFTYFNFNIPSTRSILNICFNVTCYIGQLGIDKNSVMGH